MTVWLLINTLSPYHDVCGVFSSEESARRWLAECADANGWLPSEIRCARIEPWPVDDFTV